MNDKDNFKMNLQLFAEGEGEGGEKGQEGGETEGTEGDKTAKTFTESEVDRRVTDAIKKREETLKTEFEKTISDRVQEMLNEQKRLSSLSKEEKEKEEFNKKLKELEARELKLQNSQLKADAKVILASSGLDPEAVELIIREADTDTKETLAKINLFKEIVEKASLNLLQKKMQDSSYTPAGGQGDGTAITFEDFKKMDTAQKTKLYRENRAVYEKFSKQLRGL